MKQRRWYYKHGTCYETFNILCDNSRFMLVQNDSTKTFSFGTSDSFGTIFGFGVNQSCLTKQEAIAELRRWRSIDEHSPDLVDQWNAMIYALNAIDVTAAGGFTSCSAATG